MLTATVKIEELDTALARFVAGLDNPRAFLLAWAQRTAKRARNNARSKGGRRFWTDMARSVRVAAVSATAVSVHTHHVAAAQKEFGGDIRPKNAKALTIPVTEEARARRASEFEFGGRRLFVLDRAAGDTIGLLGYGDTGGFHALFVLRSRVSQAPDPWWPSARTVARLGIEEASRFVQNKLDVL